MALLCLVLSKAEAQESSPDGYQRVKFKKSENAINKLSQKGVEIDHAYLDGDSIIAELNQSEYTAMKGVLPHRVLVDDLEKYYGEQIERNEVQAVEKTQFGCTYPSPLLFNLGSMGGYLTLSELYAELGEMEQAYPDLISIMTPLDTTLTAEGRSLYYVRISDNADTDEAETEVLYTALHHAREPLSMMSLVYFMHYLLENYDNDAEVKALLDTTELYFVPCVNPDGYVYNQLTNPNGGGMWRKNRRPLGNGVFGVDLNRNYAYQWGAMPGSSGMTSSSVYRGPSPFSEPETAMMRDFCNQHAFVTAVNIHSYSNLLIHNWEYSNAVPEPGPMNSMAICATSCNSYTHGNAYQTVGYYASGTASDWMYGEQTSKPKTFAFSPEVGAVGQGFWPGPAFIELNCQAMLFSNLAIAKYALNENPCLVNLPITSVNLAAHWQEDAATLAWEAPAEFDQTKAFSSQNGHDWVGLSLEKIIGRAGAWEAKIPEPSYVKTYYRLELQNQLGETAESNVAALEQRGFEQSLFHWSLMGRNLKLKLASSKTNGRLVITDIAGNAIFQHQVHSNEMEFRLDELSAGLYLLRYQSQAEEQVEKLVLY